LDRLRARIRGIIGLGIVGGLLGFVGGGIWGVVSSMVRSGVHLEADYFRFLAGMALGNAIGFMQIGGFTAAGFGVLLAAVESKRSLQELSLWRVGLLGALVGASFPPIYVIGSQGLTAYVAAAASFVPVMGALGVVGGLLAASLVDVAKRADRAELPSARDAPETLNGPG
jgi:hypothetical protein